MIRLVNLLIGAVFALAVTVLVASLARAQIAPGPYDATLPPAPMGWVYTQYTVCHEPRSCPVVFVSVGADGLNVRTTPNGYPVASLVNGTPLLVLDRQGAWTLVAPACDLIPTWAWSWTAGVPLERDGWRLRPAEGGHDVYKHPTRPGRLVIPRHRTLSRGVARDIANKAGWKD